jgi:hypothetical protein
MDIPQDDLDLIVSGARKVSDESRDEYFAWVAYCLRKIPNPSVFDVKRTVANALKMFDGRG